MSWFFGRSGGSKESLPLPPIETAKRPVLRYTKIPENIVDEVSRRVGITVSARVAQQLKRDWSSLPDKSFYDGFYVRSLGDQKQIVVSPLKHLEKAQIAAMEYGDREMKRVLWLHGSPEARSEVSGLNRGDDSFAFVGSVFIFDTFSFDPYGKNDREWVQELNTAVGGDQTNSVLLHDMVYGWHKLGPSGYRITSNIHRIDRKLLSGVSRDDVLIRKPTIEDLDRFGTVQDFLVTTSGSQVDTASYNYPNRLITSYFPRGYEGLQSQVSNVGDALVVAGVLGSFN